MQRLSAESHIYCCPTIAIIDDQEWQISFLRDELEAHGFRVLDFRDADALYAALKREVAQWILIDMSLRSDEDRTGLDVAAACRAIAPDAKRVCISRATVVKFDAQVIISALSPQPEQDGERLFEAFEEKQEVASLLQMVNFLRSRQVSADRAELMLDDDLLTSIEGPQLPKALLGKTADTTPDFRAQFVEVVKQLATQTSMPRVRRIQLDRITRGRSRTVICGMKVWFDDGTDTPTTAIIKIGGAAMIRREARNYSTYVRRFFRHGHYPVLESVGTSRDLAGIAYGRLGGETDVSVHFRWASGALTDDDLIRVIKNVFQQLVAQDVSRPQSAITLKQAYADRFRALGSSDEGAIISRSQEALGVLAQRKLCSEPEGDLRFGRYWNHSIPRLATTLNGEILFPRYREAVVHGDLHFENILLPLDGGTEPFLIDFAHTQRQHVFLDPIILELGCRFQLGVTLLQNGTAIDDDVLAQLVQLEFELAGLPCRDTTPRAPALERIARLIRTVRFEAAARARRETHSNYFGGLGLAASASLRLPAATDPVGRQLVDVWFTLVATLNLAKHEWHAKKERPIGPELWTSGGSLTADQQLDVVVDRLSEWLRFKLSRWLHDQARGERWHVREDQLRGSAAVVDAIVADVAVTYPLTWRRLGTLVDGLNEAIQGHASKRSAALLLSLSLLDSESDVPDSVASSVREIRRFLRLTS